MIVLYGRYYHRLEYSDISQLNGNAPHTMISRMTRLEGVE